MTSRVRRARPSPLRERRDQMPVSLDLDEGAHRDQPQRGARLRWRAGAETSVSTTSGRVRPRPGSDRLDMSRELTADGAYQAGALESPSRPPRSRSGERAEGEAAVVLGEDHRRAGPRAQGQGDGTRVVLVRMDDVGDHPCAAHSRAIASEAASELERVRRFGTRARRSARGRCARPSSIAASSRRAPSAPDRSARSGRRHPHSAQPPGLLAAEHPEDGLFGPRIPLGCYEDAQRRNSREACSARRYELGGRVRILAQVGDRRHDCRADGVARGAAIEVHGQDGREV